jgi:hypothetical protein
MALSDEYQQLINSPTGRLIELLAKVQEEEDNKRHDVVLTILVSLIEKLDNLEEQVRSLRELVEYLDKTDYDS